MKAEALAIELVSADAPDPPPPAAAPEPDMDALKLVCVTLGGAPQQVCAHINKHVPELIPGLVTIAINGNHSSVAIFCSTRRQIEKARKEGRL